MKSRHMRKARKQSPVDIDILANKIRTLIVQYFGTKEMFEETGIKPEYFDMWVKHIKSDAQENVEVHKEKDIIRLMIGIFDIKTLFVFKKFDDILRQKVKGWGWYVLMSNTPSSRDWTARYVATLAPNYGKQVTRLPPKLYHLTRKENLTKIRNKGLIPQSGRDHGSIMPRNYPDRIYLTTDQKTVTDLYENFISRKSSEKGKYALLTIDTNRIRKGTKFYEDPEMPIGSSVWTYTHIPREAISQMKDVETQERLSSIKVSRKRQPINGEIVANKFRKIVESYFLTEEMYDKIDPYWQSALSYKRWLSDNVEAIRDGIYYYDVEGLVNVYTGTFMLPHEVFQPFLKIIKGILPKWGWYILTAKLPQPDKRHGLSLTLAPNYGKQITQIPPRLYHLTLKKFVPRIQRKGLSPQSGRDHGVTKREYPNRIYFATSMNIVYDLHAGFLTRNYKEEGQYALVVVDPHKLRRGTKFYADPEMPEGYSLWTYTHIPKVAILEITDLETEERLATYQRDLFRLT